MVGHEDAAAGVTAAGRGDDVRALAIVHAERLETERRESIEKQKRRDREDEHAREAYRHHALADRLVTDLEAWELVGRLRLYLAAMAERIEHIVDDDERSAAIEWLKWCERYAAERDPFTRPIRPPEVKPPGHSEIQNFRNRLGFGSGFW